MEAFRELEIPKKPVEKDSIIPYCWNHFTESEKLEAREVLCGTQLLR
jgi:hypothetical protein